MVVCDYCGNGICSSRLHFKRTEKYITKENRNLKYCKGACISFNLDACYDCDYEREKGLMKSPDYHELLKVYIPTFIVTKEKKNA